MTSIVKKNKTVPIKLNIVAPTINNNNKNNNNKKDVRFQPQNNLQAVGGASLLSRMNYTGSSPTTSSKELVSMVSRHNSIGFPILELLKDPGHELGHKSSFVLYANKHNVVLESKLN